MPLQDEYQSLERSWTRSLRRKSPKTVAAYVQATGHFLTYLLTEDGPEVAEPVDRPATVGEIAARHIDGWVNAQQAKGYKPGGINHRYRGVQQFLHWLLDEGEIAAHPMARMKAPTVPEFHVPTIPHDHLKKLLATCGKGRTFEDARDMAILLIYIDSGGRLSEIANLRTGDVDLTVDAAYSIGKGGKPRVHSFSDAAASALERYLRHRAKHRGARLEALWLAVRGEAALGSTGIHQMVKRRCEVAKIPPINVHKFRHTMATDYLDSGGQERDLMMLAGWESPQMLARYTSTTARRRAVTAHKRKSLGDKLI